MASLPRTIAIVEDDASMRRSVRRLLNAHGFATEEYPSAESFLQRTVGGEVECLVLDVDLGGMSGIELQRRLKDDGSCPLSSSSLPSKTRHCKRTRKERVASPICANRFQAAR